MPTTIHFFNPVKFLKFTIIFSPQRQMLNSSACQLEQYSLHVLSHTLSFSYGTAQEVPYSIYTSVIPLKYMARSWNRNNYRLIYANKAWALLSLQHFHKEIENNSMHPKLMTTSHMLLSFLHTNQTCPFSNICTLWYKDKEVP